MKPLTLQEAAKFLRMSRSNLYQSQNIPRYRLPGSRRWLYDQEELEALLRQGRTAHDVEAMPKAGNDPKLATVEAGAVVEISAKRVYHRSARYR